MINLFKNKQKNQLAIDIGPTDVKLLEIFKKNGCLQIRTLGKQMLPQQVIINDTIQDVQAVANAIIKLRRQAKIKASHANVAVPDTRTILKTISLDAACPAEEWEAIVTLEAEKYIAYPLNEINFDFTVLPSPTPQMLNILLVVTLATNVAARVECLRQAGFKVGIIEPEVFAKERALRWIYADLGLDTLLFAELNCNFFKVTIVQGNSLPYIREEILVDVEGCEDNVAERINDIIFRLQRSVQFYQTNHNKIHIKTIILSCECAFIPKLAQHIHGSLGLQVIIANPFTKLGFKQNEKFIEDGAASWLLSCGLAIRHWVEPANDYH